MGRPKARGNSKSAQFTKHKERRVERKAYIAIHKVTKKPWKGKKVIFDCTTGLHAALDSAFTQGHGKGLGWRDLYDVWAYELNDGVIITKEKGNEHN